MATITLPTGYIINDVDVNFIEPHFMPLVEGETRQDSDIRHWQAAVADARKCGNPKKFGIGIVYRWESGYSNKVWVAISNGTVLYDCVAIEPTDYRMESALIKTIIDVDVEKYQEKLDK